MVLSLWYSDSERIFFLLFLRREKVTKREKITDIGWENKKRKNERNENENYYLPWGSDKKQGLRSVTLILYYCIVSVSRTDNFMNVSTVFSYRCVFALFLHNASG